jgi:hypothetical protein
MDLPQIGLIKEKALVLRLEQKSSDVTLFEFSEILQARRNVSKESLIWQWGFDFRPCLQGERIF